MSNIQDQDNQEQPHDQPKVVGFFDAISAYFKEEEKWIAAGRPYRSQAEMKTIHSICQTCPFFKPKAGLFGRYDKCGICGCNLDAEHPTFNKIAWATTNCPDNPPKW